MAQQVNNIEKVTNADLRGAFWRIWFLQIAWNFERMQALGFAYTVGPVLQKLYKTKEKFAEALKRHLEFFNTQPYLAAPIVGVTLALEEKIASDEGVEPATVSAVKAGLMGPLAGIGDSVFWFTLNPIYQALGAGLLLEGNILGAILYFLLSNATAAFVYWYGIKLGYQSGINFVAEMKGQLQKLTTTMAVMGLMMVGVMIASFVKITTPVVITVGQAKVNLQEILDKLCPNLLPLSVSLFVYWLLVKKKVKPVTLTIGILVGGVLGSYLGFLK